MRLPSVETLAEYRAIYHREDLWRPAIETVCDRHGLSDQSCVRGPDGTHIVYLVGRSHVVKLFVPLFDQDFVAERLVGVHLDGKLSVATPTIVARGRTGGWRYLVMTRVPGRPFGEVRSKMSADGRRRIAAETGQIIKLLRSLSLDGLEPLTVDWNAFLCEQVGTAAARQQDGALPWDPAEEIPAYLESVAKVLSMDFEPVLLLADITDEHVLVSESGGVWETVACVDFGDAMIGHSDYEIVAPGLTIARGEREPLRALLLSAGYPEPALDEGLGRRLMAYTLIHRYVKLEDVVAMIPEARRADSLEALTRAVWPVC